MPAGALFLDNEIPINSWRELTSFFEGKPFLVDCWTTWCGPCIAQFMYCEPLKEYLDERNIGIVYIVFDNNLDRQKWESLIKKCGLNGHHMAANSKFEADFLRTINLYPSSGFAIPRYILADKYGNIINSKMVSPSQKELLFSQIEEELIE